MPRSHQESWRSLFRLLGVRKHAVALAAAGRTEKMNSCPKVASQDALLSSSIGTISLVGWVVAGSVTNSFSRSTSQQEHLAELQELYMLDVPALEHALPSLGVPKGHGGEDYASSVPATSTATIMVVVIRTQMVRAVVFHALEKARCSPAVHASWQHWDSLCA